MKTPEELYEYHLMYKEIMKDVKPQNMTYDEIIEYLVEKCYYISCHNDMLQDQILSIQKIILQEDGMELPF
jgi:hypothetical protein